VCVPVSTITENVATEVDQVSFFFVCECLFISVHDNSKRRRSWTIFSSLGHGDIDQILSIVAREMVRRK